MNSISNFEYDMVRFLQVGLILKHLLEKELENNEKKEKTVLSTNIIKINIDLEDCVPLKKK